MALTQANILIIDDNKQILESVDLFLSRHFSYIETCSSTNNLNFLLSNNNYDIILLDMNLTPGKHSGNEGLYWLKEILKQDSEAIIILITAFGKVELAVEGIKLGAFDFILKPWDNQKLLTTIKAGVKLRKSQREVSNLKNQNTVLNELIEQNNQVIQGVSKEIKEVDQLIKKVAVTDANVLVLGENGTGKEVVARQIHKNSNRSKQIFMSVDLSALPESLFESELFGHISGAFTDAKSDKIGKIEAAQKGTLFLDEIGNLPMQLQSKLLTVLQTKTIYRLGSTKPIQVNFRLICATNKPIKELIKKELFREDLLFRINTVEINLPALRERKNDIPTFTKHFLQSFARKYGKKDLKIDEKAQKKLNDYSWPGNIRELKHSIERAVILSSKSIIATSDFTFTKLKEQNVNNEELNLVELEKMAIRKAIVKAKGNMSKAAEFLGVSRTTLYFKISKYEIQ